MGSFFATKLPLSHIFNCIFFTASCTHVRDRTGITKCEDRSTVLKNDILHIPGKFMHYFVLRIYAVFLLGPQQVSILLASRCILVFLEFIISFLVKTKRQVPVGHELPRVLPRPRLLRFVTVPLGRRRGTR